MSSPKPILKYDFLQVNSTIVADASENGQAGVIRNFDKGGATVSPETIFGHDLSVIHLPGDLDGGYIQFPNGVLKESDSCTVSLFFKCQKCDERSTLFSIGEDYVFAVLFEPISDKAFNCHIMTTAGGLSQAASGEAIRLNIGEWYCLSATFDSMANENRLTLYINGVQNATLTQKRVTCKNVSNSGEGFVGFGPYSNTSLAADIAEISIYPYVLSSSDISSLFAISDDERIRCDLKELDHLAGVTFDGDIELPKIGTYGTCFSWASSDESLITKDGKVTRPAAGTQKKTALLTVLASYGSSKLTNEFSVNIDPMPTTEEILEKELSEIEILASPPVVSDLILPLSLTSGAFVTWESSNPEVISSSGKVTRPSCSAGAKDTIVELTATASLGDAAVSRKFQLIVAAIRPQKAKPVSIHRDNSTPSLKHIKPRGSYPRLNKVLLGPGSIYSANKDRCLEYLRLLDADRMLYNFRLTFGEDTKGALPLGGWDEPTGLLRGHSTGHFLSALALSYASTGDNVIKDKLDYMVIELNRLQSLSMGCAKEFKTTCTPANASQSLWSKDPSCWGKGYLGAYSPDQFALLEQYTPYATIWAPYYTLHKIIAGLIDCYTYAGNDTALETATLLGEWVQNRLSGTTKKQRDKMWSMYIAGEYGGMNESLAALSVITGRKEFLETAKLFDNPKVFDGLRLGQDTISGIHANQHIPQIIGALEEFKASGDIKYYRIASSFWKIVTEHYAYSIGGVGRGEIFKEPDILAGNIDSDRNCETCAMYNMLKLTKRLYEYEPDNSAYMDYYERGLLNQIAASQNPMVTDKMHNGVTYMLPIGPGARREYSSDYDDFTCCHGTGMENHVKYQDSVYFESEDNHYIYVNLYMNSSLRDPDLITMEVDSRNQKAIVTIRSDSDHKLRFRVPFWAQNGMYIELNGKKICEAAGNSGYLEPDCSCRRGDVYTIHFPYSVRLELTPDTLNGSDVASICYGPYVMTHINDSTDWIELKSFSDPNECFVSSWDENNSYPVLEYYGFKFIPMYAAHNVHYHTYFKIKWI